VFFSCNNGKNAVDRTLVEFDISKDYPLKEVYLQDVADVEYLIFDDSDDDYLYTSFFNMSNDYFIANGSGFLFFDREGKSVSKVDRSGNGPGEYQIPLIPRYVDRQEELFLVTYFNGIKVYSREGEHKRDIPLPQGVVIGEMYDYDDDHLLCYDEQAKTHSFFLLSKQDGEITYISISFEKKIEMMIMGTGSNGAICLLGGYFPVLLLRTDRIFC